MDESQYLKIIKKQNKLKNSTDNPYFGRIDIKYKEDDEEEIIYIGRKRIDIDDDIIIYSWAAPIANIYEEYNSGEYKRKYIDKNTGKEVLLEGNIKGKRKIMINKSKVKDVYSYTSISEIDEEEFVKKKIEESKTERLGVIVETVQKEQNQIIRLPIEKNIIVQGCAGSGKSSVAFHRLAYLAYNYKLKNSELLAISPNKIFQGYTSNILMELGTDFNVQQVTFKEFSERILERKISNKNNTLDKISKEESKIKTSKNFKVILDKYVKSIEENFISIENVAIDDFELIDGREIGAIWKKQFGIYKINDRIEKFKGYLEKYLKEKLEDYLKMREKRDKANIDILQKYNKNPVIYNETLKLTREEQMIRTRRLKKQCLTIIRGYINNFTKIDAVSIYENLLKDEKLLNSLDSNIIYKRGVSNIINNTLENSISEIDCIPIMYLYYKINENKNKYRHIVIDECQDLSYLELAVIEGLTQSFTLVGDFNQRININKNVVSLDEINEMFKRYTFFESYCLNKSFRNSMSITNYANAILAEYFISKESIPVAFNRETEKPKVHLKMGKEQIIKAIADNVINKSNKDKNIAIILKTELATKQYYSKLSKLVKGKSINLIDNEYCKYERGINIVSAKLSKGLEFDYVIIADANEYESNEEDRRLLYIATTRALHQLEIYIESKECFITSIDNKLWDSKLKLSINPMNEGLIKTLTDGFGKLPQEYIEYIESIDNFVELATFASKLEGVEDIDKLFEEEGIVARSNIVKIEEVEKILDETSVTLENQYNAKHLEKLINSIESKGKDKFFVGKQAEVFEYIIGNINELPKLTSCKELANKLGVSTATINTTLLKLNVGSFGSFISKVKKCIKRDSKK